MVPKTSRTRVRAIDQGYAVSFRNGTDKKKRQCVVALTHVCPVAHEELPTLIFRLEELMQHLVAHVLVLVRGLPARVPHALRRVVSGIYSVIVGQSDGDA